MRKPDTSLCLNALNDFPLIGPADDLAAIIIGNLERNAIVLESNDVVILAQKIVSKAEGRLVRLADITPSARALRSEEHTSELQSLMRISYAVFCLKKKNKPAHS